MPLQSQPTPFSPDEDLAQLRTQVSTLSARVDELEKRLAAAALASGADLRYVALAKPKLESKFGLTLVNRAGAITLAIGIIFFFKYAADNQWIGQEARVAIGVVAGLLMLVAAEWQRRRDRLAQTTSLDGSIFAAGLAGCGLAAVYVALYASVGFYELILPLAGWGLLVLVSALAVILSLRYASAAIAALGFTGALLALVLLGNTAAAWWFNFFYVLVLSITALALAVKENWPLLVPGLAVLSCIAAAFSLNGKHPGWFVVFTLIAAVMHFASVRRQSDNERLFRFVYLTAHGYLLVGAMRFVSLAAIGGSSSSDHFHLVSALESVLLAIYGSLVLLYGMAKRSFIDRALGLFLLTLVVLKLYLWDVWQLSRFYQVSAFVALGVLLLAASYLYSRFRDRSSDRG
ncbi:MAG TPA: DUF2339 domain-containing protein [Bryobacteraceae bacterium]|nr:DUF2339 domain-containing protein [Bryobacteraceae bacterium]